MKISNDTLAMWACDHSEGLDPYDMAPMSCGIAEFSSLDNNPDRMLATLLGAALPIVVFSDAVRFGNGRAFAKFLRSKPKLGTVKKIAAGTNPNTNNTIEMWHYKPNYPAIRKWALEKYAEEIQEFASHEKEREHYWSRE